MASQRSIYLTGFCFAALVTLAACVPQAGLPSGPTPIPTLAPATDVVSGLQATSTSEFTIMSYPAEEPDAASGHDIYQRECAECHGEDGAGVIPAARNFRDLDYMRGETPASFYVTVTEGRGSMPAYQDRLSSDERWDVVFYIWRLATDQQTLDQGGQVYSDHCATCHGEQGDGELLGSADFTEIRQMADLAPRDLYLTVTQGRGSMPAWQSRLSQDSRWAVIDYLRTFSYDPVLGQASSDTTTSSPTTEPADECDDEQTNPFAWDDSQAIEAGQEIYQERCAFCHGEDGSGGLPDTPDFTSGEVSEQLKAEPGHNYCAILQGEGAMPGFGDSLSMEQIWEVLTFLGSLSP